MNQNHYSNIDFSELKKRINHEILRRGTYWYMDPLTTPVVGIDKKNPLSIPDDGNRVHVDERTYTINTPSEGSIEPTRNIHYQAHGDNPGGTDLTRLSKDPGLSNTSVAELNLDELKNYLIGLAKIHDINLFYGREEEVFTAFRNPQGIEDVLVDAEKSELNALLHESDISPTKVDPNNGITDHRNSSSETCDVTYPQENGMYVMPSGEYDGEELKSHIGLSVHNFYDDWGAKPGNADYHPMNPNFSEQVRRDWHDQDHDRKDIHTFVVEGGKPSSRFGPNPRNPQMGDQYKSRPAYGGKQGSCQNMCTGLCYVTCDNECGESCTTTCWNRCGNACTATCGNNCTSCSSQCSSSCKTKCENVTGYSCVKSGAKTVKIMTIGGSNGKPAENLISSTYHTCDGCSYSCQFYPNKKTECWDSGCMGKCFVDCSSSCSSSCFGGCIGNSEESGNGYKSGKGQGCSSGCTMNCIGGCEGICAGLCISTCWNACKSSCSDNCTWTCQTNCGDGCASGCTNGCTGCSHECSGDCEEKSSSKNCTGCSYNGGCSTTCMVGCDRNCMGFGCRSMCGTDSAGACTNNCRLSCTGNSCTSMCADACSDRCTTCVNGCDMQCGNCVSMCSTGCESECNITCTQECSNNCNENCVQSCSENCGACFKAGTLIETDKGLVPIEDINIGDNVLTKSGKYHKVINRFKRTCDDNLYVLRAIGTPDIFTTKDHKFWVKKYKGFKNICGKSQQIYDDPTWVKAIDIDHRDKLCLYTKSIGSASVDTRIAYMVGRWLGDGWRSDETSWNGKIYPRFSICCGYHEADDFELKLDQCNIRYSKHEKETSMEYKIPSVWWKSKMTDKEMKMEFINKELISILKLCGKHARYKFIPNEIYNWDEISLSYLVQGYMDSDGHRFSNVNGVRKFVMTTVSKKLAYGMSMILRMLDRNPGWSIKYLDGSFGNIMGRTVNMHNVYTLRSQLDDPSRLYTFKDPYTDNSWATIMKIGEPDDPYDVYNIEVEGDPSYYADGVLVHNCSSLCYSCTGMCISICSTKCDNGCSNCTNMCGWWCDSSCSRDCFSSCNNFCMISCVNSCTTGLTSEADTTAGPEREPTSEGFKYPHPKNRWEERESFKITSEIAPDVPDNIECKSKVTIAILATRQIVIVEGKFGIIQHHVCRVNRVDENENVFVADHKDVNIKNIKNIWKFCDDEYFSVHLRHVYGGEFVYLWDTMHLGEFDPDRLPYASDKSLLITNSDKLNYDIIQTSTTGGVFELNHTTGELSINEDMLPGKIDFMINSIVKDGSVFIIRFFKECNIKIEDIDFILPFGFDKIGSIVDSDGNLLVVIQRDVYLYPET